MPRTIPSYPSYTLTNKSLPSSSLNELNAEVASRVYTPLTKGQMRLVVLHSEQNSKILGSEQESEDRLVTCSLITIRIRDAPSYEVLSYVWGAEDDPLILDFNGCPYYVTHSLAYSLSCLRKKTEDRILWVDALVINQSDIAERNEEVTRIRRRYAGASQTLIMLGLTGEGRTIQKRDHVADRDPTESLEFLKDVSIAELRAAHKSGSDLSMDHQQAVQSILSMVYFTRAWVVQELMYSNKATIHHFSYTMDMAQYLEMASIYDGDVYYVSFGMSHVKGDKRLAMRPGYGKQQRFLSIPHWLDFYCVYRQCSEPRDRLFAYYGCFSQTVKNCIKVDYQRPEEEMSRDIVLAWIASEQDLNFLLEVDCHDPDNIELSISARPSWLPYFFGKPSSCVRASSIEDLGVVKAPAPRGPIGNMLQDGKALRVKGAFLGTVESIGSIGIDALGSFESFDDFLQKHVRESRGMLSNHSWYLYTTVSLYYPRAKLLKMGNDSDTIRQNLERDFRDLPAAGLAWSKMHCSPRYAAEIQLAITARAIWRAKSQALIPFGLATPSVRKGDQLYMIVGCREAIVLRPAADGYCVVGNANVFGFVDGVELQHHLHQWPSETFEDLILR